MNAMKILVVEDDKSVMNLITTTLKINQYSYITAGGGREAISMCASHKPDLTLLAANAGKVLTHSYIIDRIWGGGIETDIVSLRVYMNALRKKLRAGCPDLHLIETHIGIGYQMIRLDAPGTTDAGSGL